jgi:pyridoxamine 5'-phosphate oxidase
MQEPFKTFSEWYEGAQSKVPEPTAMNIATVSPEGKPASRIVLLKSYDERGLVFYTNSTSRKGNHLTHNQNIAVNFFWPTLNRQIRIEGEVEEVKGQEADDYYNSRHLQSRIGAWASLQSQILPSRATLLKRAAEFGLKFGLKPPRPEHWHGYRIKPRYFEFWQEGDFRLHDRNVWELKNGEWESCKLYP